MKYTKLVALNHRDNFFSTGASVEVWRKEQWLTEHFGKPGPGQRWFSRGYRKVISAPKDRRYTRSYIYGIERCLYFRDPRDLTLFSLMYNG
jgi:hypothetical protein